ncbi:MAG: hypothetical protein ACI8TP_003606 [Acidimicrobiales bacterium]|jgi:hypothetical protein
MNRGPTLRWSAAPFMSRRVMTGKAPAECQTRRPVEDVVGAIGGSGLSGSVKRRIMTRLSAAQPNFDRGRSVAGGRHRRSGKRCCVMDADCTTSHSKCPAQTCPFRLAAETAIDFSPLLGPASWLADAVSSHGDSMSRRMVMLPRSPPPAEVASLCRTFGDELVHRARTGASDASRARRQEVSLRDSDEVFEVSARSRRGGLACLTVRRRPERTPSAGCSLGSQRSTTTVQRRPKCLLHPWSSPVGPR